MKKITLLLLCLFSHLFIFAKLPDIAPAETRDLAKDIMKGHATYKQLTPQLVKRILVTYLEELDPTKTYLTQPDIQQWLEPSDAVVNQVLEEFEKGKFSVFETMQKTMDASIVRHQRLEEEVDSDRLPKNVKAEEFKDQKWVKTEKELLTRMERLKALQMEAAIKLNEKDREKAFQRIAKRQMIFEQEAMGANEDEFKRRVRVNVLKAIASSLDDHTVYFTPEEASQFMISVQQRLFGIGAQLRDDINGFTIVKIIEGGPASRVKELKVKDRIIAVNSEPVVGMDIIDAVELVRGKENTDVILTVVRETTNEDGSKKEETLNIKVTRGEVVLKESRYESILEPYGDGAIGYLRLFSFYQDPENSSGSDLRTAIQKMKDTMPIKGIILDLRYNSGGLLSQAVEVAGLFISKGVVVSIKDEKGAVQHLRNLEEDTAWKGPLIVLVNRSSASAAEIVAGTLQDYGRAIVVGDDHTFGKGSFQTFTLNVTTNGGQVNPEGEYKVTRGRYYTVSGKTPQLTGIQSDIVAPGILSETEIGEKFGKHPLENETIPDSFDDKLEDIPSAQREQIRVLYKFNMQQKLATYQPYLATLMANSKERIENNKVYQEFIKSLKDKEKEKDVEPAEEETEGVSRKADLQLLEAYNVMKDLLYLMLKSLKEEPSHGPT